MLGQKRDFLTEDSHLNVWRSGVFLVGLVLCNESFLGFALDGHSGVWDKTNRMIAGPRGLFRYP